MPAKTVLSGLSLILFIIILSYLACLGIEPGTLASIVKDYLEGKSVDILSLELIPVYKGTIKSSMYLVIIHNLTQEFSRGYSDIIFCKIISLPSKIAFKVPRKPIRVPNGTSYMHLEYLIIVKGIDKNVTGGKIVYVIPKKTVNEVEVKLELNKGNSLSKLFTGIVSPFSVGSYYTELVEVKRDNVKVKTGIELHPIPGIAVGYKVTAYTYLFFEGYHSDMYLDYIPPPDSVIWYSDGGKSTTSTSNYGPKYLVSHGSKYRLAFQVVYRLEKWKLVIGKEGITYWWYILVPDYFYASSGEAYEQVSCSECEGPPPSYATEISVSIGHYEEIKCGPGGDGVTSESWSIKVTFSYDQVTFSLKVHWYRYVDNDYFYIVYYIMEKYGDKLYWWYQDGDHTKYIVHFSWK